MSYSDKVGQDLILKAMANPLNRLASKEAQRLSLYTGLNGHDIDVFRRYTAVRNLLIIARMPNEHASAFAGEILDGEKVPKPAFEKRKMGAHGSSGSYVSDTDLMCMHKYDNYKHRLVPIISDWDGKRAMNTVEKDYLGSLNRLLISKLQHGCNDNYVAHGRALYTNVGDYFISFNRGKIQIIEGIGKMRAYYFVLGLENWHFEYGCP